VLKIARSENGYLAELEDNPIFEIDEVNQNVNFEFETVPQEPVWKTYYVDAKNGKDSNDGLSESKALKNIKKVFQINKDDPTYIEVLVKNGTYRNDKYGNGQLNNGAVVSLSDCYQIKITNFPGHRPFVQFDGSGGFVASRCSHLEIGGFNIKGPSQGITYEMAMADRLIHSNFFSGRGIVVWSGDNLYIHDNWVHDCPNSGIRVNKGDYVTIERNTVYRNTMWSSSAESAIVLADSRSIDESMEIKMKLNHNKVYQNQNFIPYYNENLGDPEYDEENQTHEARPGYGSEAQTFIIDGSGVYITRNEKYLFGYFELAHNKAYLNGINGVVVHGTSRAYVHHNEVWNNGQVPKSAPELRQNFAGLVVNGGTDVAVYENTVTTEDPEDTAFPLNNASIIVEESFGNFACIGKIAKGYGDAVTQLPEGCEEKYN